MKVIRIKDRKEREKIEKRFLSKGKILAVVSDVKDLNSDFIRKADVVILDESLGEQKLLEDL